MKYRQRFLNRQTKGELVESHTQLMGHENTTLCRAFFVKNRLEQN